LEGHGSRTGRAVKSCAMGRPSHSHGVVSVSLGFRRLMKDLNCRNFFTSSSFAVYHCHMWHSWLRLHRGSFHLRTAFLSAFFAELRTASLSALCRAINPKRRLKSRVSLDIVLVRHFVGLNYACSSCRCVSATGFYSNRWVPASAGFLVAAESSSALS
jgi:hypothetical protein